MKGLAFLPALIGMFGCGGAPAPVHFADLEALDSRFARPSAPAAKSGVEDLLKKEALSLEDVLAVADSMNPQLAIERRNIDLATAEIWQAKLYPNPSLILESRDYRTKDGATIGKAERGVGFGVPLVVSGRIGAATDLAEKEREIAAIAYVWRRREILSQVKVAFVEILAARRSVELARETRDIAKRLHDVTDERFKAQAIPEMELLKSAVNLARAETDLKLAEKRLAVSVKTLHALMGDVDFPIDQFAGELAARFTAPSLETLRGQVVAAHPLLSAAQKGREAAGLELALARAERIPDPELEVTGGLNPEDETIVEGGIRIPLPVFNRNQGKIAAAEVRIRQADSRVRAVENDLILRLTEAYRNFSAAQERATVYGEDILPKAQKALDQTNEGYKQGKFGYLDVLDAQRTLSEARIASTTALEDLNLAVTELEKLTGLKLDAGR